MRRIWIGWRALNGLRVSRAATFPKNASIRSTLHNQFRPDTRPRSGVGLHALVRPLMKSRPALSPINPATYHSGTEQGAV
jgi:hypothetical protein